MHSNHCNYNFFCNFFFYFLIWFFFCNYNSVLVRLSLRIFLAWMLLIIHHASVVAAGNRKVGALTLNPTPGQRFGGGGDGAGRRDGDRFWVRPVDAGIKTQVNGDKTDGLSRDHVVIGIIRGNELGVVPPLWEAISRPKLPSLQSWQKLSGQETLVNPSPIIIQQIFIEYCWARATLDTCSDTAECMEHNRDASPGLLQDTLTLVPSYR